MITDSYLYIAVRRKTRFIFESEGVQGKIVKIIQFSPMDDNEWNLGFGDLKSGFVDDSIVSNNQDTVKVLQTVARATYEFFNTYPDSVVIINPVDERRRKLYNRIFQRHIKDISTVCDVTGVIGTEKELYESQKYYESFKIKLKFESWN